MKVSLTYAYPKNKLISSYINFDCFDKETVKQINLFLRAVRLVKMKYYLYEFDHTNNVPQQDILNEAIEQTERVFAYELYHQWSMLKGKKWMLNGEISKNINWFYNYKEKDVPANKKKYPDLVLHKDPADDEQLIVCEIKRKNNLDGLKDDLEKLAIFTCSSESINQCFSSFKCGFFLLINGSVNDLKEEIDKLFQNDDNSGLFEQREDTKKILCVFCQPMKRRIRIEYQLLYNIINNIGHIIHK